MKVSDLLKHFTRRDIDQLDINPLLVAEEHEFSKPTCGSCRDRALSFVTKHKLWFETTANSVAEAFKRWVSVKCPYCGGDTDVWHAGGTTDRTTINFRCKSCGSVISLVVSDKAFCAQPKEENG